MAAALVVAGFILLAILIVPVIVVSLVFSRLAQQQREINALRDRLETLAAKPPDIGQPGPVARAERTASPVASQPSPVSARPSPVSAQPSPVSTQPSPVSSQPSTVSSEPSAPGSAFGVPGLGSAESLETRIGTRWLLYVGVIAIVVGVAYFEKLAFENHWVGETARVIQGGIAGLALIYAGVRFERAGYAAYGQMISGCGAAILYVSTFAAFNFYHLIDRPFAFVLMAAITAGTAILADRQRSQGLAVLAVGGGFATPFLLPGTTDAETALFGYDAVLIAGTVALSRRRDWPLLEVVSYVFTVATVSAWAQRFYTPEKYLRTEIFLTVFCAMFVAIRTPNSAVVAKVILWTAPAAYYLASLAVLATHPTAMLVWLVCLGLTSAIVAVSVGVRAAFVVWLAVMLPLLIWCVTHQSRPWLTPGLIAVATVYAMALAAQVYRESERAEFSPVDIAWLHLNGLLSFAAAYLLINAFSHAESGPVAGGFAAWHGALAATMWRRNRERALHYAGVGFTLLMVAVGLQFDGEAVTIGWAAEGAIVIALGLAQSREWLRIAGAGLFLVAIMRTADMLFSPAAINQAPLLNVRSVCAGFVIVLCYGLAWLHDRRQETFQRRIHVAAALIAAQLITVMLVTSEINAYWSAPEDTLTRELAKSVAWALYATLLIVVGLRGDYAPIRYFAILLFALTTSKVFLVDMAHLQRVYRILSVIGLGIALLVTSYLYQRTRRQTD